MTRSVNWTKERQLFKAVTETTDLMAWATDTDGYCFYISPAWFEFTGMDANEGKGLGWLDVVHPDDRDRVRKSFFQANDTQMAYGVAYMLGRADASYSLVWDVGLPKFGDDGAYHGFFGTTCSVEDYQARHDLIAAPVPDARGLCLTAREKEVLSLISEGKTTDIVSEILGITARTVETHVSNASAKLGTTNRVHTVAKALRLNAI